MTDHLPECHTSMIPDFHNERWICICDQLRACQQRMALQYLITDREQQEAEERAYAAGLESARQVVETYAQERLIKTKHPNKSEDITAALRVAADRIINMQKDMGQLPSLPPSVDELS